MGDTIRTMQLDLIPMEGNMLQDTIRTMLQGLTQMEESMLQDTMEEIRWKRGCIESIYISSGCRCTIFMWKERDEREMEFKDRYKEYGDRNRDRRKKERFQIDRNWGKSFSDRNREK